MQFKTVSALSALLLLAPALASPVATDSASTDNGVVYHDGDSLDNEPLDRPVASDNIYGLFDNIPSSIIEVLATAIPVSWYYDLMDPASQSSIISEASKGIYPAWYSALPTSVLAWASSAAAEGGDNFLFDSYAATATATGSSSASAAAVTGTSAGSSATITAAPSTKTQTGSLTSSTPASSAAASDAASSSSASVTPSTSLSTGGAAVATGSAAISFAGAVGLLGLAIAL